MAPKTKVSQLTTMMLYLEENDITFPKNFKRNLIGKENETISGEHVPTNQELALIIEHLPHS